MSKLNNWCATFRLDIFVGCRLHTGGKWYFMIFYIIVLYWIFQNIVPPCAGWDHTFWLPAFKSPHIRVFFCQFHPIFVHVKQSILIWTQNSERLNSVWGNLVNSFFFDTYSDRLIIMRLISFFGCRVCKVYFLNPCYVFSSFPSLPLLHCFVLFLMQSLHSKICPSLNQMPFRGTHT